MDEDKEKEKEPSETSKLEDSIGAFTKELERLSIDDALECTKEMLEEMERKADKLEKVLRLKMRMAKMAREEEALRRSMVVEEESANMSMGVIPLKLNPIPYFLSNQFLTFSFNSIGYF